jgi:hypothetical protein
MKFKLDFNFPATEKKLSIRKPILIAGSCFAEHIGQFLLENKFTIALNPSGILFNPLSLVKSVQDCLTPDVLDQNDCFQHDGLWHSWNLHGSFSSVEKEILLASIIESRQKAKSILDKSESMILTLGTAWVYEKKTDGKLVGNCHKVPNNTFIKRMLTVDEIIESFESLMKEEVFRNKQIILTISPVRYIHDGLIENNRSKAVLIQAVEHLCKTWPGFYYFPAYEIVIDELRDYRFYSHDLVHPNDQAVNYVTEQFAESTFDEETKEFIKVYEPIRIAGQHRPLHPDSEGFHQFKTKLDESINQLQKKYPFLQI